MQDQAEYAGLSVDGGEVLDRAFLGIRHQAQAKAVSTLLYYKRNSRTDTVLYNVVHEQGLKGFAEVQIPSISCLDSGICSQVEHQSGCFAHLLPRIT
jgi:hypothetical protein